MTKEKRKPPTLASEYALQTYDESCRRNLAERIRKWIDGHGGSYCELARVARVHWDSVAMAAAGETISVRTLRRLEFVLNRKEEENE